MRYFIALALALVMTTAIAGDTYSFSRGIVSVGDSAALLMSKGGPPTRVVQLENKFGAAVGERWEYYLGTKQVSFTISGGRVLSIDEVY